MESYFIQAIQKWLRTNPGSAVSQYNMTAILSEAYSQSASIATITNGFKAAGIWPVDKGVFSDADLQNRHHYTVAEALLNNEEAAGQTSESLSDDVNVIITPGNSNRDGAISEPRNNVSCARDSAISEETSNAKKRKVCQSAVITNSTPYKNELEIRQKEREQKASTAMKNLKELSKRAAPTKNKPNRKPSEQQMANVELGVPFESKTGPLKLPNPVQKKS
ncbi:hypothetical protein QE152_g8139 [Popillia japonica]|uniref:Uncharacterized protein n=1 Tax=Popillia japonica TaxID=7064 RepID=A0AAW1MD50_POPJA